MLKIKEGIDLDILLKYGFKKEKITPYSEYYYYSTDTYSENERGILLYIYCKNRELSINTIHEGELNGDIIYDLIKDGLVVKEGKNEQN